MRSERRHSLHAFSHNKPEALLSNTQLISPCMTGAFRVNVYSKTTISPSTTAIQGGPGGHRANPFWHTILSLLSGPDVEVLPPTSKHAELSKLGLVTPQSRT
ncbi:hypothetical protein AMECASPLE_030591 [Ameca splendens]|uniref:Uncharacterized protein n=1 Tax=Ameca splendens TaxID=208324 RepID=A0ABV0YHL4_9TELE